MGRLIVDACTAELIGGDLYYTLLVGVSVSRADDGIPVTGLTAENFRVASFIGSVQDFKVSSAYEKKWEPQDTTLSGIYELSIQLQPVGSFVKGKRYVFGIQARVFNSSNFPTDHGQTVLELISTGE